MSKESYDYFRSVGMIDSNNQVRVPDAEVLKKKYYRLCSMIPTATGVYSGHFTESAWIDALDVAFGFGVEDKSAIQLEMAWCLICLKSSLTWYAGDCAGSDLPVVGCEDDLVADAGFSDQGAGEVCETGEVGVREISVIEDIPEDYSIGFPQELDYFRKMQLNIFTEYTEAVTWLHLLFPHWSFTLVSRIEEPISLYGTSVFENVKNVYIGYLYHTWMRGLSKNDEYYSIKPGDVAWMLGKLHQAITGEDVFFVWKTLFTKNPDSVDGLRFAAKQNPYPEDIRDRVSRNILITGHVSEYSVELLGRYPVILITRNRNLFERFWEVCPRSGLILIDENGLTVEEIVDRSRKYFNVFVGDRNLYNKFISTRTINIDMKVLYMNDFNRLAYYIAKTVMGSTVIGEYPLQGSPTSYIFDPNYNAKDGGTKGCPLSAKQWNSMADRKVNIFAQSEDLAEELHKICPTWTFSYLAVEQDRSWVCLYGGYPCADGYNVLISNNTESSPFFIDIRIEHETAYTDMYNIHKELFAEEKQTEPTHVSARDRDGVQSRNNSNSANFESILSSLNSSIVNIYTEDESYVRSIYELYPSWSYTVVKGGSEEVHLFNTCVHESGYSVLLYGNQELGFERHFDGKVKHFGTYSDLAEIAKIVSERRSR